MKIYQDLEKHHPKGENNNESMKMIFKNSHQVKTRSNPYKMKNNKLFLSNQYPNGNTNIVTPMF